MRNARDNLSEGDFIKKEIGGCELDSIYEEFFSVQVVRLFMFTRRDPLSEGYGLCSKCFHIICLERD